MDLHCWELRKSFTCLKLHLELAAANFKSFQGTGICALVEVGADSRKLNCVPLLLYQTIAYRGQDRDYNTQHSHVGLVSSLVGIHVNTGRGVYIGEKK